MDQRLQVLTELGFHFTEEELRRLGPAIDWGYENMLGMLGMRTFNSGFTEWTSGSDQVFALDCEAADPGNMYPNFFQGLLSISGGELPITDVEQDDSGVNFERGDGTTRVSFRYAGKPYTFELEANYDWLDCIVLAKINEVLEKEGVTKRFYACWNEFQGMTIFYKDEVWAARFQKLTGCELFTVPKNPF